MMETSLFPSIFLKKNLTSERSSVRGKKMWRWRCRFFRVFFVPLPFSLCSMERTSCVRFFLPDGVFCLVTTIP